MLAGKGNVFKSCLKRGVILGLGFIYTDIMKGKVSLSCLKKDRQSLVTGSFTQEYEGKEFRKWS